MVTAFIIESSKLLQPDYTQVNALLTAHLLATLSSTNSSSETSFVSMLPKPSEILTFSKPRSAEAVNILWYAALGLSLASVLVAMLVKQWLVCYQSHVTKHVDPHNSACERQRRFDDLHRWSLPHIIALLPALLHAGLFIFLVGLIIYMWQLDWRVSVPTIVILGILFVMYFVSVALATFSPSCPYNTPLSQYIRSRLPTAFVASSRYSTKDDVLIFRCLMWLTATKDPDTVSLALQSLSGLRRRFGGHNPSQISHLARLTLERLRRCFVPEWRQRHGGMYCLRTETQFEASCYSRALLNLVDDERSEKAAFEVISTDAALPIFLRLLGECKNHSMALLALCDNQRLLHRTELMRWMAVRGADGLHNKYQAAQFIRHGPSVDNMVRIIHSLDEYIKGNIFLQPLAVEIAVETMGFAPLPWMHSVSTQDLEVLSLLLRLRHATQDGGQGIRKAIASTLSIFAKINGVRRMADTEMDLTDRFEVALRAIKDIESKGDSEETVRSILLDSLSYFAACGKGGKGNQESYERILDALFDEVDRRKDSEDLSFCDTPALSAMLPLLPASSLGDEEKLRIVTRLKATAISSLSSQNLAQNNLLYHITPRDPFPPNTVSILLSALTTNEAPTPPWLRDVATLLYLVTCEETHRSQLFANGSVVSVLIRDAVSDEIPNYLFWIFTEAILQVTSKTAMKAAASGGALSVLNRYHQKYGLCSDDIEAWIDIFLSFPAMSDQSSSHGELVQSLYRSIGSVSLAAKKSQWLREVQDLLCQDTQMQTSQVALVTRRMFMLHNRRDTLPVYSWIRGSGRYNPIRYNL